MKNILKFMFISILVTAFVACNLDLVNPNAATEEQVLKTKEGLFGLATGMQQTYATNALGNSINTIAVTTREASGVTTYSSLEELENGGSELAGDNERISRTFYNAHRVKGMAEDILNNVSETDMTEATKAGLYALAGLYKAMTLGILAQNWEQVAIDNSRDGESQFSSREDAFKAATDLIKESLSKLSENELSGEFVGAFMSEEELANKLNLYLARFELFAGNYQEAINATNQVDATKAYFFNYDGESKNPVYVMFVEDLIELAPRDNFGLASSFDIDPNDGRLAFYFESADATSLVGLPVDNLICTFFNTESSSIPFYNPSELDLIKAEAYARTDKLTEAEDALNKVRNKLAADDVLGVGLAAGLTDTFTANGDKQVLLDEIYKNRRMEMYLSGVALEDSRRFNRPEPSGSTDFTTERNRNFYPFPASERASNPNTPNDPSL